MATENRHVDRFPLKGSGVFIPSVKAAARRSGATERKEDTHVIFTQRKRPGSR